MKEEKMPPLTPEENELARKHGLSEGQIAWRRKQWQTLRGLAAQEYAEDPSSCFLVSGECVFELAAIEKALALAGEGMEVERQRQAYDLVSAAERETVHPWSTNRKIWVGCFKPYVPEMFPKEEVYGLLVSIAARDCFRACVSERNQGTFRQ